MINQRSVAFLPSIMVLVLTIALVSGCSDINSPSMDDNNSPDTMTMLKGQSGPNKVVHRVSVGSNDACESFGDEKGCDGNFSLVALQREDGSVKGQWHDQLKQESGLHIAVDCMIVDGNTAIVGGVITKGADNGAFATGTRAVTKVSDNGTSKNDTPDQISYSYWARSSFTCADYKSANFPFEMLELTTGQVKVQ